MTRSEGGAGYGGKRTRGGKRVQLALADSAVQKFRSS